MELSSIKSGVVGDEFIYKTTRNKNGTSQSRPSSLKDGEKLSGSISRLLTYILSLYGLLNADHYIFTRLSCKLASSILRDHHKLKVPKTCPSENTWDGRFLASAIHRLLKTNAFRFESRASGGLDLLTIFMSFVRQSIRTISL